MELGIRIWPQTLCSKACTLQLSVETLRIKSHHLNPVPLHQYSIFKGPEIKYHHDYCLKFLHFLPFSFLFSLFPSLFYYLFVYICDIKHYKVVNFFVRALSSLAAAWSINLTNKSVNLRIWGWDCFSYWIEYISMLWDLLISTYPHISIKIADVLWNGKFFIVVI